MTEKLTKKPIILWFRRDLRLADHIALQEALGQDAPVIPVFIRDELVDDLGSAPKWRLGLGLEALERSLETRGSRLILRSGAAQSVLDTLIEETGARGVFWTRAYDPRSIVRDKAIKAHLSAKNIDARSFAGHLLFEPWTVETKTGGYYKVYTPFWNAVRDRHLSTPEGAPSRVPGPDSWPMSDSLNSWRLDRAMNRGAAICAPYQIVGEDQAQDRLAWFVDGPVQNYDTARDLPGEDGTSRLSAALALGEISPRLCWHAALRAREEGARGAEVWIKELVWREFAYHLMYHTPEILTQNWRPEWEGFPWSTDPDTPYVRAWQQGRTGERFVDAAMRELYVTGTMHNRARMIVASYLTKHLLTHWKIGLDWFADCLTDWDPASNALGWQWTAGCGPDASPYFRIFNPATQLGKFDKHGTYTGRWIAEGQSNPSQSALDYFRAVPQSWELSPDAPYPRPIVDLAQGRAKALDAYQAYK